MNEKRYSWTPIVTLDLERLKLYSLGKHSRRRRFHKLAALEKEPIEYYFLEYIGKENVLIPWEQYAMPFRLPFYTVHDGFGHLEPSYATIWYR